MINFFNEAVLNKIKKLRSNHNIFRKTKEKINNPRYSFLLAKLFFYSIPEEHKVK